jgi:hypothetical protein
MQIGSVFRLDPDPDSAKYLDPDLYSVNFQISPSGSCHNEKQKLYQT